MNIRLQLVYSLGLHSLKMNMLGTRLGLGHEISFLFLPTRYYLLGTCMSSRRAPGGRLACGGEPRILSPLDPHASSIAIGPLGLPALVPTRTPRQTCLLRHNPSTSTRISRCRVERVETLAPRGVGMSHVVYRLAASLQRRSWFLTTQVQVHRYISPQQPSGFQVLRFLFSIFFNS
jgi:hypothetical protein